MGTFLDGVGTFNMTGGTVNGSVGNSLTAASGLNLQAGTVNANIGNSSVSISNGTTTINGTVGGAVTVSSGTANLNGALSSSLTASGGTANVAAAVNGNVTVSGGTVNLGAADLVTNTASVSVSDGSLALNGNESVGVVTVSGGSISGSGTLTGASYAVQGGAISATIGGSGPMTKTGSGTTTLSADNSGFSGAVAVNEGSLLATTSGALGNGAVTMTNGSTLAGSGVTLANNFTIGSAAGVTTNNFTAYWNFGTTNGNASATTTTGSGVTFGSVSQGNNNGTTTLLTTTTASSSYTGASGQFNAGAAARTGALNTGASGSAYFEFSITAGSGFTFSLTNMTFGSRSTGTGPQLASLLSSLDSYASALATNGLSANSTWALVSPTVAASTSTNGTVTFRIYGSAGSGSAGANTANWRIDDLNLFGYSVSDQPASGSGTLGINEAGSATFSGNVVNNNVATLTAASGGTATFSGVISGLGSVTKTGDGTVTLSGDNTYSGGTTNSAGVLSIGAGGTSGSISGNVVNNATLQFNRSDSLNYAGAISGTGALTKLGAGTTTLSGAFANTYTGMTTVSAGTLELSKSADVNAIAGDITVNSGAILLLSSSGNVANSSAVTLSGGTITRGSGVNEVFGSLNLTTGSFLDFGTGATGSMTFGTYEENATPSALLTLNNFIPGNSFTFSNALFAADGSNIGSYFTFGAGFVNSSIINNGGNSFTITAIPEPSTYAAAIGLLGLMLWPSRKRLIKDAKKILGFTPPMRDRLAAKRA
jgi:autotransporter-associated beta strand protein